MMKIMKKLWDKNQVALENKLLNTKGLNSCGYDTLVKIAFETVYNEDEEVKDKLDLKNIIEIDHGGYQGTLLYMIPFDTYQPSSSDYFMTAVSYGSCSGCDTLQSIQEWELGDNYTNAQITEFMGLCRDILMSAINPYNFGWREDEKYSQVTELVDRHVPSNTDGVEVSKNE